MKRLKSTQKFTAITLSIVTTFLCTASPVSAFNKSAASSYAIKYSGGECPIPVKYREAEDGYNPYYSAYQGNDCTNYVSQILYTGGFVQTSTPSNRSVSGDGCKSYDSANWYFRKIYDKYSDLVSVWTSSWTISDNKTGVIPGHGLYSRLKNHLNIRRNENLTFSELLNLSGSDRVKEGDIIQISSDYFHINYGHSIYVIYSPYNPHTGQNTDILFCGHSNDRFYRSLKSFYNGDSSTKFVVWHTSDY